MMLCFRGSKNSKQNSQNERMQGVVKFDQALCPHSFWNVKTTFNGHGDVIFAKFKAFFQHV